VLGIGRRDKAGQVARRDDQPTDAASTPAAGERSSSDGESGSPGAIAGMPSPSMIGGKSPLASPESETNGEEPTPASSESNSSPPTDASIPRAHKEQLPVGSTGTPVEEVGGEEVGGEETDGNAGGEHAMPAGVASNSAAATTRAQPSERTEAPTQDRDSSPGEGGSPQPPQEATDGSDTDGVDVQHVRSVPDVGSVDLIEPPRESRNGGDGVAPSPTPTEAPPAMVEPAPDDGDSETAKPEARSNATTGTGGGHVDVGATGINGAEADRVDPDELGPGSRESSGEGSLVPTSTSEAGPAGTTAEHHELEPAAGQATGEAVQESDHLRAPTAAATGMDEQVGVSTRAAQLPGPDRIVVGEPDQAMAKRGDQGRPSGQQQTAADRPGRIPDGANGEPSTIRRLRATSFTERSGDQETFDGSSIRDQPTHGTKRGRGLQNRAARLDRDGEPDESGPPPGLEPGVDEIARRLRVRAPTLETDEGDGGIAPPVTDDALGTSTAHSSTETSAARPQEENISAVQAPTGPTRASVAPERSSLRRGSNVSRETSELEGTAHRVGEDDVMEDEASIAVRKAALRAAAEVNGTSEAGQPGGSSPGARSDVSRETIADQSSVAEGDAQPDDVTGQEGSPTPLPADTEQAARDARVTFRITHGGYSKYAVAVANQKGGVGKSTTAVNLGAYLALAGARILVVDLDPQGNASTGLGLDHRRIEPSVYDVLMGEAEAADAIRQTPVSNLDILPSTIDLAGAEVELVNALSRETRLRQALGTVRYGYDVVFIDCPPSLGLLTVNALAAADELLIPIQCEYYALEGLGQLLRNVDLVRVNLNPGLHIGGIVLTMYDGRTRLAEQVVQEVRKHFSDLVYHTVVPRSVRLSEAPGYGVPIALYDPLSRGGIAYRDLAFELADRTGLLAPTREGAS
jgi:chromosome partitioning protein